MSVIQKTLQLEGSKGTAEATALFDSGASYSCINPQLAAQLGALEPLRRPLTLGTAKNGDTLSATHRVTLDFYLQGYHFSDEFLLIPDLSEQLIIGATTLQKWRFKLDFENDEVIIDPRVTKLRLLRLGAPNGYNGRAGKYLAHARTLLKRRDYAQASEKFWGAAALAVKHIAAARGWKHHSHKDLIYALDRIAGERNDPELQKAFAVAQVLHANFYEDFMPPRTVRIYASEIERFVLALGGPPAKG